MQLQIDYDDWVEEEAHELIKRAQNELANWIGSPFIPVEQIAGDILFLDILPLKKALIGEGIAAALEAEKGGGTIYYRGEDSFESRRFSIAHEIGHYTCHFLPNQEVESMGLFYRKQCFASEVTLEYKFKKQTEELAKCSSDERAKKLKRAQEEAQANRFAAELLMPANLIKLYYEKLNGNALRLAELFKVSLAAMKIRIDDLGLRLSTLTLSQENLLGGLNPQQRKAVKTINGQLIILAGAGTGKTRVITNRIAYLIGVKKIDPRNILAVTFTNKAACEMRERIEGLLGGIKSGRTLWVKTFHSLCLIILRREEKNVPYKPNFTIADESAKKTLIRGICNTFGLGGSDDVKLLAEKISLFKNILIPADTIRSHSHIDKKIQDAYIEYQRRLKLLNQMDFDDIILNAILLFSEKPSLLQKYQNRFKYILVDEYQDTNYIQFFLLKELAKKNGNLCVVGDDDQAIYGWRGASIENFNRLNEQFKNVLIIPLEQNYRSSKTILSVANQFISGNIMRLQSKKLWTSTGLGEKVAYAAFDKEETEVYNVALEIRNLLKHGIRPNEIAIMYRMHSQSRVIENELVRQKIPYQIVHNVSFMERSEVKDILALLRFVCNPDDNESVLRVLGIKTIAKGIGVTTVKKLKTKAFDLKTSIWKVLKIELDKLQLKPNIVKNLTYFMTVMNELTMIYSQFLPSRVIETITSKISYYQYLEITYGKGQDGIDWQDRKENVEELIKMAQVLEEQEGNTVSLNGFIDQLTLLEPTDESSENIKISLMTVHSAKGLEFENVFLIGLEEGIFPHSRNKDLQEERRLFYVAITRAKRKLYFSSSTKKWNIYKRQNEFMNASTFLDDISDSDFKEWPIYHDFSIT